MIAGARVACQYFLNAGMMGRPDEIRSKRVSKLSAEGICMLA